MPTTTHTEAQQDRRLVTRVAASLVLVGSMSVTALSLLLLFVATHAGSRLFALSVLTLSALAGWWAMSVRRRWQAPRLPMILATLGLAVALWISAAWVSPSGESQQDSPLISIYRGAHRFSRVSPAWVVDEADQIRLGGLLLPWIDPFMSQRQGRRFATSFNNTYTDLNESRDFVSIGSAMPEAYLDMFLPCSSTGHAYLYRPSNALGERLPVIVFLHGWLGNMKAYMWTLSRFAEEHGFVVICPTFRNGLWEREDADDTLRWLSGVIREDSTCDPDRVIVIGLSNGGTGVTRWATVLPETLWALVFVSPVLRHTADADFVSAVGTRPILVVHGGQDTRIPPDYVDQAVSQMRSAGVRVQSICYPEEDHVLVLSAQERFHTDLLKWIEQWEREQAPAGDALKAAPEE